MTDKDIVNTAIKNIKNYIGINVIWTEKKTKNGGQMYDGTLKMLHGDKEFKYLVEIKQALRPHQFVHIETLKNQANLPFLLIIKRLTPEMRMELRNKNIEYMEANGNMYINRNELIISVDGQRPIRTGDVTTNRAFTKTGLKVIFHLLIIDDLINKPYREIAATANVALGNINYIFTGLKEMGFLIQLTKNQYKLTNKKKLLDRWLTGYTEKLKPALQQGKYAFTTEVAQKNWRDIKLHADQTFWSGEPAGDLLTNHLRPELFTIYSTEKPNDIIRNYKLIPNDKGSISIYLKFWNIPETNLINIVPPLLVYADLIMTTDKRCRETANIIYDKYIQPNL